VSDFVVTPTYPDVPQAPGVPPLLRPPGFLSAGVSLDIGGLTLSAGLSFGPQWGIFDQSGLLLLLPDNIVGFNFRVEALLSDYQQEQGAFATYNKVQTPFESGVRMSIGGPTFVRSIFVQTLMQLQKSLELVTVLSPEYSWPSANIIGFDENERTAESGATLLTVNVKLREVRNQGTSQFTSTAAPSGANTTTTGQVQAQDSPYDLTGAQLG